MYWVIMAGLILIHLLTDGLRKVTSNSILEVISACNILNESLIPEKEGELTYQMGIIARP